MIVRSTDGTDQAVNSVSNPTSSRHPDLMDKSAQNDDSAYANTHFF
jgi:hypothetical protein